MPVNISKKKVKEQINKLTTKLNDEINKHLAKISEETDGLIDISVDFTLTEGSSGFRLKDTSGQIDTKYKQYWQ